MMARGDDKMVGPLGCLSDCGGGYEMVGHLAHSFSWGGGFKILASGSGEEMGAGVCGELR